MEGPVKYLSIVFSIILFVILYVWQNIEVMKIKMDYRRTVRLENGLVRENDRLRYEMERYRRMDLVEAYAEKRGMKRMTPSDFEIISMKNRK